MAELSRGANICPHCRATTWVEDETTLREAFCSWCGESLTSEIPEGAPEPDPDTPGGSSGEPDAEPIPLPEHAAAPAPEPPTPVATAPAPTPVVEGDYCARCGDLIPGEAGRPVGDALFCERCAGAAASGERDLRTESELRGLGLMAVIGGGIATVGGVLLVICGVVLIPIGISEDEEMIIIGIVLAVIALIYAGLGVLGILVGRGLRRFVRWARLTAGIIALVFAGLAVLQLVLVLVVMSATSMSGGAQAGAVGASIAVQVLAQLSSVAFYAVPGWYLLRARSARVTTPEYRALVALEPDRKRPFSIFLIVFLALLALGLVFVLGAILLAASM